MSDVYSKRLASGLVNTAGPTLLIGTVPAGSVWILRDWVFVQNQTGSCRARLSASLTTGDLDRTVLLAQNDSVFRSQRHIVLEAGEALTLSAANVTGSIVLSCNVHGYELTA